jgi:hypothetical protein
MYIYIFKHTHTHTHTHAHTHTHKHSNVSALLYMPYTVTILKTFEKKMTGYVCVSE